MLLYRCTLSGFTLHGQAVLGLYIVYVGATRITLTNRPSYISTVSGDDHVTLWVKVVCRVRALKPFLYRRLRVKGLSVFIVAFLLHPWWTMTTSVTPISWQLPCPYCPCCLVHEHCIDLHCQGRGFACWLAQSCRRAFFRSGSTQLHPYIAALLEWGAAHMVFGIVTRFEFSAQPFHFAILERTLREIWQRSRTRRTRDKANTIKLKRKLSRSCCDAFPGCNG